ncbi:hypothetical protein BFL38_10005 [Brachyspira hampsonii]|uniref:Uncharacterized protein n=1 Tax=Brachyspira hampsonii TaxID=1287055 RepID=A0A1E5NI37_9SPIR|nr:hypothetical protein [Brachyspira hampsonii]OEJ15786.1 hypothetical protein BFL38_10005 [Brachyspira hampsonii]
MGAYRVNDDVLFVSVRSQNAIKNIINIDKYDLTNQDELSILLILDTLKDYSIEIKIDKINNQ